MLKWNDDGAREDARARQPSQDVRSPSDLIVRLFQDAAVASSSRECLEISLLNSRKTEQNGIFMENHRKHQHNW